MLTTPHRPVVESRRGSAGGVLRASPVGWQVRRACVLAFLAGVSTGCYTYTPIQTSMARPGMEISLDVSDRGRVSLADSIGPSVDKIEGSVQQRTDSGYVLSVSAVEYVNGRRVKWAGEPLSVQDQQVAVARERRFSRMRTVLVTAVAVGAVLAVALTRDLFGTGTVEREPPDPGPGPDK